MYHVVSIIIMINLQIQDGGLRLLYHSLLDIFEVQMHALPYIYMYNEALSYLLFITL